ncbi:hypothetical protein F4804DRAFT_85702 [Jackrogersella minutella]|nr:hypothetical protein F4804DRAFT_85702 [Jackrogersella minutella]
MDSSLKPKNVGRKAKALSKRSIKRTTPHTDSRPRHSNKKKKEVLVWLAQVRIPLETSVYLPRLKQPTRATCLTAADDLSLVEPGYRGPTYREAAEFFKIPKSTIALWWKERDIIISG